ncbi:MAG: tRNA (N6-isopentenyl adenosine(37)-C2)-methylthiotransferase MiaB, partial [Oscillospiraceae bacterium]
MLAHVHSYGCQQNVSDGEKIKGLLAIMGYTFCDTPDEADIVIYNTCAVRENAEDRVFGNIGELKHNKERNPEMIIGLCGCMMQQEHISQKIKKSYPQVDIVFGTHVLTKLPQMIYNTLTSHKRQFDISDKDIQIVENIPIVRDKTFAKANLPIMYGCNNFCTYCIVPYVRGRERSRKSADIITEFKSLVADGFKEITLLGQNVNSYGKGLDEDINFSKLLRVLNQIEGEFRIRFMSSHPKDATFELIDAIADCDKVCKHFHLPIQSGSNRVLSLMNRKYTTESYQKLIEYARKRIPDIAFTSDIIVGFPSET